MNPIKVTVYGVTRTFLDPVSAALWVAHVKGTGRAKK